MYKLGIKRLAANFISLLVITIVISIYFGFTISVRSVTSNLKGAFSHTIENHDLEDFEVTSSLGFDDDSLNSIKKIADVTAVNMGSIYDVVDTNTEVFHLTTMNLHINVNTLELISGRMPITDDEVVLEAIGENKYNLGDKITLDDSVSSILTNKTLEIVGFVNSNLYFSKYGEKSKIYTSNYLYQMIIKDSAIALENPNAIVIKSSNVGEVIKKLDSMGQELNLDLVNKFKLEKQAEVDQQQQQLDDLKIDYAKQMALIYYGSYTSYLDDVANLQQIIDMQQNIDTSAANINNIQPGKWYFKTIDEYHGYSLFQDGINRISNIIKPLPNLLLIFVSLVIFTNVLNVIKKNSKISKQLEHLEISKIYEYLFYLVYSFIAASLAYLLAVIYLTPNFIEFLIRFYQRVYNFDISYNFDYLLNFTKYYAFIFGLTTLSFLYNYFRDYLDINLIKVNLKSAYLNHIVRSTLKYTFRNIAYIIVVFLIFITVVLGLSIKPDIVNTINVQYNDIYKYQYVGLVDSENEFINDDYGLRFSSDHITLTYNNLNYLTDLIIPSDNASLSDFIKLDKPVTKDSVIISSNLSKYLDLNIGDKLKFTLNSSDVEFEITDITTSYTNNFVIISNDFANFAEYNNIFIKSNNLSENQIITNYNLTNIESTNESLQNELSIINNFSQSDMLIVIAISLLILIVVIYLADINLMYRNKAVKTIFASGFSKLEVAFSLLCEYLILSLIGIFGGLIAMKSLLVKLLDYISSINITYLSKISFTPVLYALLFIAIINGILFLTFLIRLKDD